MTQRIFEVICIRAKPAEVWRALTDPCVTERYWFYGCPMILSNLKTLLECGMPLPDFEFAPQPARFA